MGVMGHYAPLGWYGEVHPSGATGWHTDMDLISTAHDIPAAVDHGRRMAWFDEGTGFRFAFISQHSGSSNVKVWRDTGEVIGQVTPLPGNQYSVDVAFSATGDLYLLYARNEMTGPRLYRYDAALGFVWFCDITDNFSSHAFEPAAMTYVPSLHELWVVGKSWYSYVYRYSADTGAFISAAQIPLRATGIDRGDDGRTYLTTLFPHPADALGGRDGICVVGDDGGVLATFLAPPTWGPPGRYLMDVSCCDGRVGSVSPYNQNILVFDMASGAVVADALIPCLFRNTTSGTESWRGLALFNGDEALLTGDSRIVRAQYQGGGVVESAPRYIHWKHRTAFWRG